MTNGPVETHSDWQRFKSTDASSYDNVTDSFDRFTYRYSPPLVSQLIASAELNDSSTVLDIGTGTGIVALGVADSLDRDGRVVGVDLSDGMLSAAKRKAALSGFEDRVVFKKMDAESLEFEAKSFDAVLSLFALLHFPDPQSALKEMYRVLKPGGRLVIGVGSGPALFSLSGLVHRLRRLSELPLRLSGRLLSAPSFLNSLVDKYLADIVGEEESDLARSHKNRARVVPALIRRAGFTHQRTNWKGCCAELESPEEFWELQKTFSSIARKRLEQAPSDSFNALHDEFVTECRNVQSRGGKLIYPYAAFFVVAQRPLD